MKTVSQTAVNSVINSIRIGDTSHVDAFFAARPDWTEQTEETKQETSEQIGDITPWYCQPGVCPWTDPYWR